MTSSWAGNMLALINRDELVTGLARHMISRSLAHIPVQWTATNQYLVKIKKQLDKSRLLTVDFGQVNNLLYQDLRDHKDRITTRYKDIYRPLCAWLVENFDRLPVSRDQWLAMFESQGHGFVNILAQQLDQQHVWCLPKEPVPDDRPVLIRNIINNESLLQHRVKEKLPFWFVDSGYTNFLTGQKTWHRLVANSLHHAPDPDRDFPADRLSLLPNFPQQWRQAGNAILIIENSEYHYQLKGTTLEDWRKYVLQKLKPYTDRDIVFRPKDLDRKTRDNLYEHLCASDYYCVVTDASASAIEAVWAGIPIITLGQHISVPVARTTLAQINNLYRGPVGNWLCALTYSQWTLAEMQSGLAVKMTQKYHA